MKDVLFLIVVLILVGIVLYFGYIFVVQKSLLPSTPPEKKTEDPLDAMKLQSRKTEDTWQQQEDMMEAQKQRMQDLQHR